MALHQMNDAVASLLRIELGMNKIVQLSKTGQVEQQILNQYIALLSLVFEDFFS